MADKAATKKKFFEKMKDHMQKKEAAKLVEGSDNSMCFCFKLVQLVHDFASPNCRKILITSTHSIGFWFEQ